jgi:patatin-like phospholipase/acyl hydrolase
MSSRRLVKVLSIDGGGVRGIIPSFVLANIENFLPKNVHIRDSFDVIAGTSVGGLIALLLSVPDENGRPKYTAEFIDDQLFKLSQCIFKRSALQFLKSGGGLIGAKYDVSAFEEELNNFFGDIKLSQSIKDVIIPAYELELNKTFFFSKQAAIEEPFRNCDCLIRELVRATTAAPTYFKPAILKMGSGHELKCIDGGVSANDPTAIACLHAKEIFGEDIDLLVVSLGTGTIYGAEDKKTTLEDMQSSGLIGWAKNIVGLLLSSENSIVDYEMRQETKINSNYTYYRFQPVIEPKYYDIDNASDDNMYMLKMYGNDLVTSNIDKIHEIVRKLLNEP